MVQKRVLERQTFETLARDSKLSKSTLQRTFKIILKQAPKTKIIKRENVHLRIDGTYFNQFCLIAYQDDYDGHTQLIRFTDGEHHSEVKEGVENLIRLGVKIESITCNGQKSVLKAIKDADKNISDTVVLSTFTANVFDLAYAISKASGRSRTS